jgi:hydrogenase maturation protease
METCSPRANEAEDELGTIAIVGLGNPFYGDDGVGPLVAQRLYEILCHKADFVLLEPGASGFRLAERLVGYQRVVIIDAFTNSPLEVGTVNRVAILNSPGCSLLTLHTVGFHDGLALARMVGLEVPRSIVLYGIVIREPGCFSETLSAELTAKLPQIVEAIAAEQMRQ